MASASGSSSDSSDSESAAPGLSEYEQLRQRNIARNAAVMRSLGLTPDDLTAHGYLHRNHGAGGGGGGKKKAPAKKRAKNCMKRKLG